MSKQAGPMQLSSHPSAPGLTSRKSGKQHQQQQHLSGNSEYADADMASLCIEVPQPSSSCNSGLFDVDLSSDSSSEPRSPSALPASPEKGHQNEIVSAPHSSSPPPSPFGSMCVSLDEGQENEIGSAPYASAPSAPEICAGICRMAKLKDHQSRRLQFDLPAFPSHRPGSVAPLTHMTFTELDLSNCGLHDDDVAGLCSILLQASLVLMC